MTYSPLPLALIMAMAVNGESALQSGRPGQPAGGRATSPQTRPAPPAERLGNGKYRIGAITVDTTAHELSVVGVINRGVTTLEFVANTPGGQKSYESAVTITADAISFNAALLLLGLDQARGKAPARHFDPATPKGDRVELWIEWQAGPSKKRVRAEQLLFDERTGRTMEEGPWVYTGSTFVGGRFLAELDGVLVGFVHSPAPVIENPRQGAVSAYGKVTFNQRLGLQGGMPVTFIVKAIDGRSADVKR